MEYLLLDFQPITDEGIAYLSHLRSLKSLRLCGTRITDKGLQRIALLTNLENLALRDTAVTDKGLEHLSALQQLRHLDLTGVNISGSGLMHCARMDRLESLSISSMLIRSEDLRWLCGLRNLKELGLSSTSIDDSAGVYIARLPALGVAVRREHRRRRRLHVTYRCDADTRTSGHRGHEGVKCVDKHHMCFSEFGDLFWPDTPDWMTPPSSGLLKSPRRMLRQPGTSASPQRLQRTKPNGRPGRGAAKQRLKRFREVAFNDR